MTLLEDQFDNVCAAENAITKGLGVLQACYESPGTMVGTSELKRMLGEALASITDAVEIISHWAVLLETAVSEEQGA